MAADLGRDVDMTTYYYFAEALNLLLICLLLAFHIFRIRSRQYQKSERKSPKLCGILDLKTVSYIMLSFYIIRGIIVLLTFITNKQWKYLNASSCHFLMVLNISLIHLARYCIHLFLAIRSRLSSYNATYSLWSKLGFVFMTSDLLLLFAIFIVSEWIMMDISADGTQCVTLGFSWVIIVWVIVNDVIISGYTLCVFILPLRKIIILEKQRKNIEINIQQTTQTVPTSKRNFGAFATRIIWCSLGALLTTIIACIISLTFGIIQGITSPLLMFIRCYLVVMQFSFINIDEIGTNQVFWRGLVILFQWDQWKRICKRFIGCDWGDFSKNEHYH